LRIPQNFTKTPHKSIAVPFVCDIREWKNAVAFFSEEVGSVSSSGPCGYTPLAIM